MAPSEKMIDAALEAFEPFHGNPRLMIEGMLKAYEAAREPTPEGPTLSTREEIAAKLDVTPHRFGAVGNGVSDDTDAIHEALDFRSAVAAKDAEIARLRAELDARLPRALPFAGAELYIEEGCEVTYAAGRTTVSVKRPPAPIATFVAANFGVPKDAEIAEAERPAPYDEAFEEGWASGKARGDARAEKAEAELADTRERLERLREAFAVFIEAVKLTSTEEELMLDDEFERLLSTLAPRIANGLERAEVALREAKSAATVEHGQSQNGAADCGFKVPHGGFSAGYFAAVVPQAPSEAVKPGSPLRDRSELLQRLVADDLNKANIRLGPAAEHAEPSEMERVALQAEQQEPNAEIEALRRLMRSAYDLLDKSISEIIAGQSDRKNEEGGS